VRIIFKLFLKTQKFYIGLFVIGFLTSAVASYIYMGGPKSISAVLSGIIGFCLIQYLAYRNFKKENNWK